jgi:hypothetical protein
VVAAQFLSIVTPNPGAIFSDLIFTQGIDPDTYQPLNPGTVFQNPVGHVYCLFSYDGMLDGSQWTAPGSARESRSISRLNPDGGTGGFGYTDWEPQPYEWLPGEYEVQIFTGTLWKVSGHSPEGEAPTPPPSPRRPAPAPPPAPQPHAHAHADPHLNPTITRTPTEGLRQHRSHPPQPPGRSRPPHSRPVTPHLPPGHYIYTDLTLTGQPSPTVTNTKIPIIPRLPPPPPTPAGRQPSQPRSPPPSPGTPPIRQHLE